MTDIVPLVLGILLVSSSAAALLVKRLVWSLILLFYSSLLLGGILAWYGAIYASLFQIITFAGAVSVMFMVIIMLVGQDTPEPYSLDTRHIVGVVLSIASFMLFALFLDGPVTNSATSTASPSGSDLKFLWSYQSWDLVFLLFPVTAAVLAVVNLFSKKDERE